MNRKRYVLPSILILGLAASFAVAQNINKAIQLSQDPTGVIGVDSNNNVYFPGHLLTIGPPTPPALTSCGATASAITGTDTAGTIVGGAATNVAGCVITFNKAYLATPYCMVQSENPATTLIAFTLSTTAITIGGTNMGAATVHYYCTGSK